MEQTEGEREREGGRERGRTARRGRGERGGADRLIVKGDAGAVWSKEWPVGLMGTGLVVADNRWRNSV